MSTTRKIWYGISALLLVGILVDLGIYFMTRQEEVLWCMLGFFALVGCGVVMWLKMR